MPEYSRGSPKHIFTICNNAVNEAIRAEFGAPTGGDAPANISALLAVALMQLSLRYFVATKASKEVVSEFFLKLMGLEEKAELKEKHHGLLSIEPPDSPFAKKRNG